MSSKIVPHMITTKTEPTKQPEWDHFLAELLAETKYPERQRAAIQRTWQHIVELVPKIIRPTVRCWSHPAPANGEDAASKEWTICFSWSKRKLSIEVEFHNSGIFSWHFADHSTTYFAGSEEPSAELDRQFFTLLKLFKKTRSRGGGT